MSFKCELLYSIFMSIYFSIIDIRKYVIKKITKTKAPEAID